MRPDAIHINRWQSTREFAVRQTQAARFQERQNRVAIEELEWPAPAALSWREQIVGAAMVFQILWWAISGKLFRAM